MSKSNFYSAKVTKRIGGARTRP